MRFLLALLLSGCTPDYALSHQAESLQAPTPISVTDEFVQDVPTDMLDVLAVVDTSCSMGNDKHRLAAGLAYMILDLHSADIDWTLTYAAAAHGLVSRGPSTLGGDAGLEEVLALTLEVFALSSFHAESGLAGAMVAEPLTRKEADLLIIMISDEDDLSYQIVDNTNVLIPPTEWVSWAKGTRPEGGIDVISLVALGSPCGARGQRYIDTMKLGDWTTTDLCSEWPSVLPEISRLTRLQTSWTLSERPIEGTIEVLVDGNEEDEWTIAGQTLMFSAPPPNQALIQVTYETYPDW